MLAAVGRFFSTHAWRAESVENAAPVTDDDVLVFPPGNKWTVVLWPGFFTELAAAEFISRDLGVLTSTVRIHDGDYWSHSLVHNGVTLDRFATMPDYFTDDQEEVARLMAKYAGRPAVVAEAVGCPVERIAPYLVPVDTEYDEEEEGHLVIDPDTGKAFADDEFELDSPWVFVDFWRGFGPSLSGGSVGVCGTAPPRTRAVGQTSRRPRRTVSGRSAGFALISRSVPR